jgi:formylglycine-generating enzyme required for sulfatase activity
MMARIATFASQSTAAVLFACNAALAASPPSTYTNGIGIEFVLIAPGGMQEAVFQPSCPAVTDPVVAPERGDTLDARILWTRADVDLCHQLAQRDASNGFRVKIAKAFYIGKFEITQGQWMKVMGHNPSFFQGAKVKDDATRHPVENITWEDTQTFLKRLNRLENTHAYRLPTEFEWEYAGRAGGPGQVPWDVIRRQAVQGLRADHDGVKPTTHMAGSKEPNAWGLYDMLGNVWEWVEDLYNEKTFPDPVPPTRGTQHVLKGAGFVSDVKNAIYATHGAGPGDGWDVGFRIVREVEQ